MELSLHGSQINLTVRDKPPTPPAIHYPAAASPTSAPNITSPTNATPLRRRPESACHLRRGSTTAGGGGIGGNRFSTRPTTALSASSFVNDPPHRRRMRPVSADNAQNTNGGGGGGNGNGGVLQTTFVGRTALKKDTIEAAAASKTTTTGALEAAQIYKRSSSSNILNLLLAEPIRKQSTTSWNNAEHKLSMANDDTADNSSVEEDIAGNGSSSTDEDIAAQATASANATKSLLPSAVSVDRHNFIVRQGARSTSGIANAPKKYVTFSKEPEIVPRTSADNLSLAAGTKPDLPGRVSFSTADVFELDFSDGDDEQSTPRPSVTGSKATANGNRDFQTLNNSSNEMRSPKPNEMNAVKLPQSVEHGGNPPSSCCSLNCSSLAMRNEDTTAASTPKKVPNFPADNLDESDQIIAEYKREIAKLNRDHEQSMGRICNDDPNRRNDALGKDTNNVKDGRHQSAGKIVNTPVEPPKSSSSSIENVLKSTDGNHVQANQITIDSSSVVINNYLKTTKELPHIEKVAPKKSTNIPTPSNPPPPRTNAKPKAPPVATSRRTATKPISTTKSQRDDSRLNEFQLDKVESWMSIHEFSADVPTMGNGDGGNSAKAEAPLAQTLNRDTPTSKTDDEGMYSYDDLPDGADSSTYEEIASVLKEIEEERDHDDGLAHIAKRQNNQAAVDKTGGTESPDKMREILAYLDGVESSCVQTMQDTYAGHIPDSFRSDIEFAVEPDIIGEMPKIADLITLPNQQLARRVIALSLRANELASAIQLSRQHMASVRTEKVRTVRAEKHTAAQRLADQKRHFESVVQRHQAFIEQLLKDKTCLADKVSALNRRIDSQNQAWQHKMETELIRMKETTLAGEKIRRERWVRENTKKIKELTVKGLEHEINQMTATHQAQLADLRRQQQHDLLQAVEEERHKHEQLENSIRAAYALDREGAIEKERNAIRERFERQIDSEQQSFEQQRIRMVADFGAEKQRLQAALHDKELEFERRREALVEERKAAVCQVQTELTGRLKAADHKHQSDLQSVQAQFESDFKIWRREHEAASKLRETERESCVRREAHLERDRQIDGIVAKLDAENMKNQQEFEQKLSRLHEKHTHELGQLEHAESCMRDKFTECRAKLAETEAARDIALATAKQHEIQLQHVQQLYDAQLKEKESLKEAARRDVQQELAVLRKDRDTEIERIYARVQQAIERKDATVETLHKENAALKERCVKLEAVVRQQRQDYFVK